MEIQDEMELLQFQVYSFHHFDGACGKSLYIWNSAFLGKNT